MRKTTIEELLEMFSNLTISTTVSITDSENEPLFTGNLSEIPIELYELEIDYFGHYGKTPNDRLEIVTE